VATEKMVRLNLAKEILLDPIKRRNYDNQTTAQPSNSKTEEWLNREAESYGARFSEVLFARIGIAIAEGLFDSLFGDVGKD
jgi:DnaJ-class molecular chaperone